MSKIGLLTMSDASTKLYLKRLTNQDINLIPCFPDFKQINELLPGPSTRLDSILQTLLLKVDHYNVEDLIVPNITIHQSLDPIVNKHHFGFQLIHPIVSAVKSFRQKNINHICLFGTRHSMKDGYISEYFKNIGIQLMFPTKADVRMIDKYRLSIFNETVTLNQKSQYESILNEYAMTIPVLLACTELSIAHDQQPKDNVYDLSLMHIQSIIRS